MKLQSVKELFALKRSIALLQREEEPDDDKIRVELDKLRDGTRALKELADTCEEGEASEEDDKKATELGVNTHDFGRTRVAFLRAWELHERASLPPVDPQPPSGSKKRKADELEPTHDELLKLSIEQFHEACMGFNEEESHVNWMMLPAMVWGEQLRAKIDAGVLAFGEGNTKEGEEHLGKDQLEWLSFIIDGSLDADLSPFKTPDSWEDAMVKHENEYSCDPLTPLRIGLTTYMSVLDVMEQLDASFRIEALDTVAGWFGGYLFDARNSEKDPLKLKLQEVQKKVLVGDASIAALGVWAEMDDVAGAKGKGKKTIELLRESIKAIDDISEDDQPPGLRMMQYKKLAGVYSQQISFHEEGDEELKELKAELEKVKKDGGVEESDDDGEEDGE